MSRLLRRGLAILLAAWTLPAPDAAAARIREIRIVNLGPGPLREESVRPLLSLREGDPFDRAAAIADVRRLQASGRFSQADLQAETEGDEIVLILALRGKPLLARLGIEGSTALGNRRIAELLELSLGDPVDDDVLAAGARRIEDEYLKRYYPYARVTWILDADEENGRADVRLTIREGPRARVRSIRIEGSRQVRESEIRGVLRQNRFLPFNPWHWVTGRGRFDPDLAEADARSLRMAYWNRGYLDAAVEGPEIFVDGRAIQLVFSVREGALYRIGDVSLEGHSLFGEPELRRAHGLVAGAPASLSAIDEAAASIEEYYGNRGYFGTSVRRAIDADADTGRVDVRFQIREGRLGWIRDVAIQGNRITRDKVIRRELVVVPGERYDASRVRASERRLRNLGYFSQVMSSFSETPEPDRVDLYFDVEEGQMGMASAGVGFSSIESVSGFFEISHGNVALNDWPPFGGGQKLRLRGQVGTRSNTVETEFTEPWFLNRQLSLGVNLFRSEYRYLSADYNQRNTGGRVSLTRALAPFWRGSVEYGLQRIDIFDVSESASGVIREEEGERLKSSVTLSVTRDTRRQEFRGALPTGGQLVRLSAGYSGGPLGGDTDLYELNAQGTRYLTTWGRHVLVLRARAGVVEPTRSDGRVPLFDRFFLGGPTTVRGFRFRHVGPRDENATPIGGASLAFASAEYSVPLVPHIRGAVFYDAGMVWPEAYSFDSRWNSSYGAGVRLDIPMLPIRLDYAWPLETDEFTERKKGRFSFWIGHGF